MLNIDNVLNQQVELIAIQTDNIEEYHINHDAASIQFSDQERAILSILVIPMVEWG